MKIAILLTPFVLFSLSCSSLPDDYQKEVIWEDFPSYIPSSEIRYVKTTDVFETTRVCKRMNVRLQPGELIIACATLGTEPCLIFTHYTEEEMPEKLKEHEIKHCKGYTHN